MWCGCCLGLEFGRVWLAIWVVSDWFSWCCVILDLFACFGVLAWQLLVCCLISMFARVGCCCLVVVCSFGLDGLV